MNGRTEGKDLPRKELDFGFLSSHVIGWAIPVSVGMCSIICLQKCHQKCFCFGGFGVVFFFWSFSSLYFTDSRCRNPESAPTSENITSVFFEAVVSPLVVHRQPPKQLVFICTNSRQVRFLMAGRVQLLSQ